MIRVQWSEGQALGSKDIPSNVDMKVAEGVMVFLGEDHGVIYVAVPVARFLSAVELGALNA